MFAKLPSYPGARSGHLHGADRTPGPSSEEHPEAHARATSHCPSDRNSLIPRQPSGTHVPPPKDGEGPPFSSAPQRPRHGLFPRPAANARPTRTVLLLLVPGGEGPVTALLLPGCRSEARKGAPAVNEGYEGLASERKELRHAEFLAWQTASSRCHLSFLRKRK